ncbi:MAG: RidA family protein [Betaproteobacteria bacterium]|jgi:enamine deaminase RidA (YjgF/YER057c/UK114 family)
MKTLQPPGWARPRGYANGIAARGTQVFIAGQVGWNAEQRFEADDFVAQAAQALRNVVAVLAEAGAAPQHIVRMTWYVVDKAEYLACLGPLGRAYRAVIGRHYPAMTAIEVKGLVEEGARVEIEVTAVVPDTIGRAEAAGR